MVEIFQDLHKKYQKEDIILPDVLKFRDQAISKLNEMKDGPYPGGYEEDDLAKQGKDKPVSTGRNVKHTLVKTYMRLLSSKE